MQGENHHQPQETSARVRHVPIQVESRNNRPRGATHPRQFAEKNRADQLHDQRHSPYNYHGNHHTLPNTSSININYHPQQNSATNTNSQPSQEQATNQRDNKRNNDHVEQEQRQSSPDKSSSTQENLASPPEVIPLPPPPKSPEPNTSKDGNNEPDQEQQQQSRQQQQPQQQSCKSDEKKPKDVFTCINDVKSDVTNLLKAIASFTGTSAKSKEYRYLDEMLTRSILKLDQIECGDSSELRQYRKAAIKLVDRATDILQRKLQINSDIHDLSGNVTAPS